MKIIGVFIGPVTGKARIGMYDSTGFLDWFMRKDGSFAYPSGFNASYQGNSIREAIGFLKSKYKVRQLRNEEVPRNCRNSETRWFKVKGERNVLHS